MRGLVSEYCNIFRLLFDVFIHLLTFVYVFPWEAQSLNFVSKRHIKNIKFISLKLFSFALSVKRSSSRLGGKNER